MTLKPFLRWAGGKRWLTNKLIDLIPEEIESYYEPFLGSGSLFFKIFQKFGDKISYELSDINKELINSFIIVRDNPQELCEALNKYSNSRDEYYKVRETQCNTDLDCAAKFIYLNRTSFNGIYRVNKKGIYNVPYGYKQYKTLFDFDNLMNCSKALKNVKLIVRSFEEIEKIKNNSFFYLDPPYTIAHEKNGFIKYNQKIFSWNDQKKLAEFLKFIDNNKALYIMSNAYHSSTLELFNSCGSINIEKRASVIGGIKAKRTHVKEILVSNYLFGDNNG